MKSVLLASLVLGFSTLAQAQIRFEPVSRCTSSVMVKGDNGNFGYACSFYPTQVQVAEYRSTASTIAGLVQRIEELEKRLQTLESQR